jgi:hypothetical protein
MARIEGDATMAPYVNIFAKGPDGSLGDTLAASYRAWLQRNAAAPSAASGGSLNALAPGGSAVAPPAPAIAAEAAKAQLRSAISHAALLSDTLDKWAATISMLRQSGIDPSGYEDFDKGRALLMTLASPAAQPDSGPDGDAAATV